MNKQEILRQLQSRIDRRSNEISHSEACKEECGDEFTYEEIKYLRKLRSEQTLDKRIIGQLILENKSIASMWREAHKLVVSDEYEN